MPLAIPRDPKGEAIHLPDRAAVRDHFANAIIAYRVATGVMNWTPIEIDLRQLGEHSVFATLHWNAFDADGRGSPRHLDELPTARHCRRLALPLIHESLLAERSPWIVALACVACGNIPDVSESDLKA